MYSQRLAEITARLRANPLDGQGISQLLTFRKDLARAFLSAPPDHLESLFKSDPGKAHGELRAHGIAGYPAQAFDQPTVTSITTELLRNPASSGTPGKILAGMLYEGPHALLSCDVLPAIPGWFLDDFLKYLLGVPPLFKVEGEVELYNRHLSRWIDHFHTNILANPASTYWNDVLRGFLSHASFFPLYFSWGNLRDIYRKRAELIEFSLDLWGFQRDFVFAPRRPDSSRIRFGVLAPNFAPRSETFATLPVFSQLDRHLIEVILVAEAARDKPDLEAYCATFADRLVDIPQDVRPAVEAIRALDLDALWIAPNITAGASLFTYLAAHRLARVQMIGGCCPTTSGFHNIDVFVSGNLTEPPDTAQEQYTEKLVCMDGPVLCFDFGPGGNNQTAIHARDRSSLGIPASAIVFASGANFFKITPELEKTWIRILAAVPGSRLLLYPFNPNWKKSYLVGPILLRMSAACKRLGVDGNRLTFVPPLPTIADIRETLARTTDVYLDSFPHSGMTSLIDPLLVGVPTVVLEGNSQRARMASGALRDIGIPELIASDEESYIRLAVRLGQDTHMREELARQIRKKMARPPNFLDSRWCGAEMMRVLKTLVAE
jgi:predicted O-linked N-acetylglucosamine transferase (SPINDLY family)